MSAKHMVSVDLVGRLLRVNSTFIYLCGICGNIHEWRSDGCDLIKCPLEPKERLRLRCDIREELETKVVSSKNQQTGRSRQSCHVCKKICTGNGLTLLHVGSFRNIHLDLCSTHLPPAHMNKYLLDTNDFSRWLHNTSTVLVGGRKKRRF
jgi:hypothetical protein